MNRNGLGGKLPGSWNVGGLHLVPADPRDTSMDSPARIAEREASRGVELEKLMRLRDTPVFKCDEVDDVEEVFMVLPVIHVRVRTGDRDQAKRDIRAWLAIQVGGAHVKGFMDWSIGPDVEVV